MTLDILQSFTSNNRVPPSYVHGLVTVAVCPTDRSDKCFQMLKKVLYRARRDTLFKQYLYDSDCLSGVFNVLMDWTGAHKVVLCQAFSRYLTMEYASLHKPSETPIPLRQPELADSYDSGVQRWGPLFLHIWWTLGHRYILMSLPLPRVTQGG